MLYGTTWLNKYNGVTTSQPQHGSYLFILQGLTTSLSVTYLRSMRRIRVTNACDGVWSMRRIRVTNASDGLWSMRRIRVTNASDGLFWFSRLAKRSTSRTRPHKALLSLLGYSKNSFSCRKASTVVRSSSYQLSVPVITV